MEKNIPGETKRKQTLRGNGEAKKVRRPRRESLRIKSVRISLQRRNNRMGGIMKLETDKGAYESKKDKKV